MKHPDQPNREKSPDDNGYTRREFVSQVAIGGVSMALGSSMLGSHAFAQEKTAVDQKESADLVTVGMTVNDQPHSLRVDPRMTLLDALREKLLLFGTKKGCDHGQCGACTVLVNGRRINSCLMLAGMCNDAVVTTVEGLANKESLHPMQAAFIKHDAFQCGYCTPGQICSAVGLLSEGHAKTPAEIRELMSGNICRCGAYLNIVNAIREAGAIT